MDNAKSRPTEHINTSADINSGAGIFRGKPEITGRMGFLIISVVCVISTIIFACGSFGVVSVVKGDIVLLAIYILITLFVVFFTVFSFRYPYRTRKELIFEGIWFSKNKIWLGEQEIELKKECTIDNLMNDECTNCIPANWKQTKRVSCIDNTEISMVVQMVNSKSDSKDYRIEKIHILKEKDDLHYDFDLRPTVLLINGILSPCNTLTLIDQLRKIAEGTKPIQNSGGNCNLYITSPGYALGDLSNRMKSAGDVNKIEQTMTVLETGKFIDKENSNFLISLIKDYGWKIELNHLQ